MKRFFRTRRTLLIVALFIIATPVAWLMARSRKPVDNTLVTHVKRGDFTVTVSSTGELRAPKYVKIMGPANAGQADQYQFKIEWIETEGKVIKEGDEVVRLDRAGILQKLTETDLAVQKADAQNQQASLDSTLNLSKAREDMRVAALTLEEQKLAKDQSQFEAPSVKRQAEISYEKALRALRQDSMDYKTKTDQAIAKMREVGTDLTRSKNKLQIIKDVMAGYSIKAPAGGMLIYLRDWDGKKKGIGSQIGSWDPTVATLPDLSVLESVTYVNEIDVRKLAIGQSATLTLDADPSKKFRGTVTQVANSGEQRPNSNAKVFEVVVNVEHPDTTLRPGMTTGNAVETYTAKNVLHVPLEAVLTEQGVPFVYRRAGGSVTKQEVERGAMNDEEVIIDRGIDANDEILLSAPVDHDKYKVIRLPNSKVQSADSAAGQKLPPAPPPPAPTKGGDSKGAGSTKPADTKAMVPPPKKS